ncbi:nitrate reductase, putative [Ricinus communis]|uniref:Nitrate reductase, putative n=1 Tax=Ricinus communis TaxID=3988 RepID=B9TG56_RICCO|nr:nitrate reductase, putative [Ricinus communis]
MPPFEEPDDAYPFFLTTGRLVYHFHTRTKTGRAPELAAAAPDDSVQIAREDAERHGIADGDWVRVTSRRGAAEARARVGDIGPGEVFMSFHFGYWDEPDRARAANELTIYEWDPVSKQPHYKYAAVRVEKVAAPTTRQPERMDPAQPGVPDPASGETGVAHALKEAKDVLVEGWEKAKPRAPPGQGIRTDPRHPPGRAGHRPAVPRIRAVVRRLGRCPRSLHPAVRGATRRRAETPRRCPVGTAQAGRLRHAARPARPVAAGEREHDLARHPRAGGALAARQGIRGRHPADPSPEQAPARVAAWPHPPGGAPDAGGAELMRTGQVLQAVAPPFAAALVLALIGLLGMWLGTPWLFPSLGPTIAIQAASLTLPSARPWNVCAGHPIGLASGIAAAFLTGAAGTPGVAEATTLLFALGALQPELRSAITVAGGVALVALLGEPCRRMLAREERN